MSACSQPSVFTVFSLFCNCPKSLKPLGLVVLRPCIADIFGLQAFLLYLRLGKKLESLSHWKARVRQCDTQSVQHHYLGIWPAGWVPKALKHGRFLHPNAGRCQRICMNVCGKGMVTYETSNRSLASACKKGAFNNWPKAVSPWDLLYCDVGLLAFWVCKLSSSSCTTRKSFALMTRVRDIQKVQFFIAAFEDSIETKVKFFEIGMPTSQLRFGKFSGVFVCSSAERQIRQTCRSKNLWSEGVKQTLVSKQQTVFYKLFWHLETLQERSTILFARIMYPRASVFRRISDRQLFVDFQIQCSRFWWGDLFVHVAEKHGADVANCQSKYFSFFANNLETFKVKPNRVWQNPQLLQTSLFDVPLLEEWCSLEHSSLYVAKDKVETSACSEQHKRVVIVSFRWTGRSDDFSQNTRFVGMTMTQQRFPSMAGTHARGAI